MGMPRCKHGWMSSCLEGCEDAYKPNFDDVWEYLSASECVGGGGHSGDYGWLPSCDGRSR